MDYLVVVSIACYAHDAQSIALLLLFFTKVKPIRDQISSLGHLCAELIAGPSHRYPIPPPFSSALLLLLL